MKYKYLLLLFPLLLVSCDRTVVNIDNIKEGTRLTSIEIKEVLHNVNLKNQEHLSSVQINQTGSIQTDSLHGEGFGYYQETTISQLIEFGSTRNYYNLPQERFSFFSSEKTEYRDRTSITNINMSGTLYACHYFNEEEGTYEKNKYVIKMDGDFSRTEDDYNFDFEMSGNVGWMFLNSSNNDNPYYSESQIDYVFSFDKWISYDCDYENKETDDYKIDFTFKEFYVDYVNEAQVVKNDDNSYTLYHREIVKREVKYGEALITFADITSTIIEIDNNYLITSFESTLNRYSDGDYDGNVYNELREYGSSITKSEFNYYHSNTFEPVPGGDYSTNF